MNYWEFVSMASASSEPLRDLRVESTPFPEQLTPDNCSPILARLLAFIAFGSAMQRISITSVIQNGFPFRVPLRAFRRCARSPGSLTNGSSFSPLQLNLG